MNATTIGAITLALVFITHLVALPEGTENQPLLGIIRQDEDDEWCAYQNVLLEPVQLCGDWDSEDEEPMSDQEWNDLDEEEPIDPIWIGGGGGYNPIGEEE